MVCSLRVLKMRYSVHRYTFLLFLCNCRKCCFEFEPGKFDRVWLKKVYQRANCQLRR